MKNLNESLLETIDLIQESTIDAELGVLFAIGEEYAKVDMLMEYADEEVIDEYGIIQESMLFMEDGEEADESKDEEDKKKKGKIGNTIRKAKEIGGKIKNTQIGKFITWLGRLIAGVLRKIANIFDKDAKAMRAGFKATGKEAGALEKELNSTLGEWMKEKYATDAESHKIRIRNAQRFYEIAKKKIFDVQSKRNDVSVSVYVPTFHEKFEKLVKKIVNHEGNIHDDFDMKKLVSFEYVDYFTISDFLWKESDAIQDIINKIDTYVAKTKLAQDEAKYGIANVLEENSASGEYVKKLKFQASAAHSEMLDAMWAFYEVISAVTHSLLDVEYEYDKEKAKKKAEVDAAKKNEKAFSDTDNEDVKKAIQGED